MIVLIGGEKGGTGKSTIATNLAALLAHQGADVCLVDTDPQGTSAAWVSERTQNPELGKVHCVQRTGKGIYSDLVEYGKRYGEVIIDAGGRDSAELRGALVAADVLISPLRPSQSDIWTVEQMAHLVAMTREMRPSYDARVMLSMAPTNPRINETAEATEALAEYDHSGQLTLETAILRERKVFRDAMCQGVGVIELNDNKAISELCALAAHIYGDAIVKPWIH